MLASISTAMVSCGVLGGTLALIVVVSHHLAIAERETHETLIAINIVTPKIQNQEATFIPLNTISVATSPLITTRPPALLRSTPPTEQLIPSTTLAVAKDLDFEELDFDNPFSKPKPAVDKATRAGTKTSGKTIAKKASKSDTRKTTAGLAKKITSPASLISRSIPNYPSSARRKGIEGSVIVTVTIGVSGNISSSHISRSSGHPSLDSSALTAARKFRFKPAINGLGQYVAVKRAIPFNFQITG